MAECEWEMVIAMADLALVLLTVGLFLVLALVVSGAEKL
jgi:hypothetical protein